MAEKPRNSRKQRSDGEGSIYQEHRKDCPRPVDGKGRPKCACRWVGAIVLGYVDGKPIRRKVSATSKAQAAALLREKREEYADQQLPTDGKPITVEKWMRYWLTQIAAKKVRPATLATYETKVYHYIIPLLGHHRLDRLEPEHIEAAWDHLLTVGSPKAEKPEPLSPATVRMAHRILSRALKVAVQKRKRTGLRMNPADSNSMDAPSVPEVEMQVLDVEAVRKVLEAARGDRLEARWAVALGLGLRQGEALGLRWSDVDLDDGVLRVRQTLSRVKGKGLVFGEPKSSRSRRDLALHPELVRLLKAHKKAQAAERLAAGTAWTDHDLVFTQVDGKPLDPSRDSKAWHALLVKAKAPKVRLHDARHSAATVMLLQGLSTRAVMETMGHSQISVTMRYQHVVDELKREVAQKTGDALWG